MPRLSAPILITSVFAANAALADVPRVVTDVPPVHSLVSSIMQGVGTPDLILDPGSSPHSHVMRPSEAQALQSADIIFWVGPELTPWLSDPISVLSKRALVHEMLEVDGTVTLSFREDLNDDEHNDHEEHDGHGHEGIDPHAWLDPQNGVIWLGAIADLLAKSDPENADLYRKNAVWRRPRSWRYPKPSPPL